MRKEERRKLINEIIKEQRKLLNKAGPEAFFPFNCKIHKYRTRKYENFNIHLNTIPHISSGVMPCKGCGIPVHFENHLVGNQILCQKCYFKAGGK